MSQESHPGHNDAEDSAILPERVRADGCTAYSAQADKIRGRIHEIGFASLKSTWGDLALRWNWYFKTKKSAFETACGWQR